MVRLRVGSNTASEPAGGPGLYAYALAPGRLYRVSSQLDVRYAFTGPAQLAVVEGIGADVGQIVEHRLDESPAPSPDRPAATAVGRPRVAVLPHATSAPQAAEGGMVFLTTAATFPAGPSAPITTALFRLGPGGRIDRLADALDGFAPAFAVSPDGRRILFRQAAAEPPADKPPGTKPPGVPPTTAAATPPDELAVMDADGGHRHRVMDLDAMPGQGAMLPAWHGNGRVTFVSAQSQIVAAADGKPAKQAYDVVDYDVPPDGPMVPVQTLSRDWPADLKPTPAGPHVQDVPTPARPPRPAAGGT